MNHRRRNALALASLLITFGVGVTLQSRGCGAESREQGWAGIRACGAREEPVWTCAMHPQIRWMNRADAQSAEWISFLRRPSTTRDTRQHATTRGELIKLSPRARALAAIETAPVARATSRAEIRLLGRIDYDETRIRTVTPWTAGRIDQLRVRVTGAQIKRNQVVASLYSPEIYSAMRDLVSASEQSERLANGLQGSAELAQKALGASKERLRLLGVPSAQIEAVIRTEKPPTHIEVRSPFAGTVLERLVDEGQYVSAGTPLFRIADLSRVWVQMDAL